MRCDCGSLTYYGDEAKDGGLCEACYVGELEAIAMQSEWQQKWIDRLEKVAEKVREYRDTEREYESKNICSCEELAEIRRTMFTALAELEVKDE